MSDADIVGGLRDLLGATLVAYLGEVKETRAVAQWAAGERRPSTAAIIRLRTAYQAAALLGGADHAGVVRTAYQAAALLGGADHAGVVRTAYQAAALLGGADHAGVVRAWFQGMNPQLEDVARARVLREQALDEAGPVIIAAARAFDRR